MSEHRFFLQRPLPAGPGPVELPISADDLHHAVNVLRLRAGEVLEVFEPEAKAGWRVRVVRASTDALTAEPIERLEPKVERTGPRIVLVQGVAKGDKMDSIVRQAVELGVDQVVPLSTSRSVVRMDRKKRAEKGERWRRVAKAAAEQSHRNAVPPVSDPAPLSELLRSLAGYDALVVLWEEERDRQLGEVLEPWYHRTDARLALVVGPEGGLSPEEVAQLKSVGGVPATLGSTVLRTETAAVAALAIALFATGGLGGKRD